MDAEALPGRALKDVRELAVKENKNSRALVGNGSDNSTPSLSPGAAAGESPKSGEAGEAPIGDEQAETGGEPRAVALDISSPTAVDVEVPTPRGVDQMSPDGLQGDYRTYKEAECLYCGDKQMFKGWIAFKKHTLALCKAKPVNRSVDELKNDVLKYWNNIPNVDATELAQALANDADATDDESEEDDEGPRSGEVRIRAEVATGNNDISDSEDGEGGRAAARRENPGTLFDDVLNADNQNTTKQASQTNRKRRQAGRPSRYTIDEEDDDQEYDIIPVATQEYPDEIACSCGLCGRTFKTVRGRNVHASRCAGVRVENAPASAFVNASSGEHVCDKCGKMFPTFGGLKLHRVRWCKGMVSDNGADIVSSKTLVSSGSLREMETTKRARRCLLRQSEDCDHANTSFKTFNALQEHMEQCHGVRVVLRGNTTDSQLVQVPQIFDEEENDEEQHVEDVHPPESAELMVIHGKRRACTECQKKMLSSKALIDHYRKAHGIWAYTNDRNLRGVQQAQATQEPDTITPVKPASDKRNGYFVEPRKCECGRAFTWPPAWAAHIRRCNVWAANGSGGNPSQVAAGVRQARVMEPMREVELDRSCRYCQECPTGEYRCKSFRQLCDHYKKEHNIVLLAVPGGEEFEEADEMDAATDLEEVDETEAGEVDSAGANDVEVNGVSHEHAQVEMLNGHLDCTECDFRGKNHKGLKVHMRLVHNLQVKSIEPPITRPSKRLRADGPVDQGAAFDDDVLVPVKYTSQRDSRALVTVTSPSAMIVAEAGDNEQLVKAFNKLSQDHATLLKTTETLLARVQALEASARAQMRGGDASAEIQRINPHEYGFSPIVTFGRHVTLCGVTASDEVEPTTTGQMRQAMVNLVELLVQAGTDAMHLLSVHVYITDIREQFNVSKVWDKFFSDCGIDQKDRPVRYITQTFASKDAMLRVELGAQAVLPTGRALPRGVPKPSALAVE